MAYNTLQGSLILSNGDMTGNLVSSIVCIQLLDNIGIQLNFTGDSGQFPTGTFQILVSIDHKEINGNVEVTGTFVPLDNALFSSAPVASGAAGNISLNLNQLSQPYLKVAYTASSGKGRLDVFISGKAI